MPFFSIIIPTYHSEQTIASCLASIHAQTFTDYEILVIDGQSSDGTVPMLAAFQKQCPQLRWVSEPDKGIYDAMNKGIKLAQGEWIYFLGSDDFLFNHLVLEKIYHRIINACVDFLYGNVYLRSNGQIYDHEFDINKLLFEKNICHQSIVYHKNIFNKIGLFNTQFVLWADWDFNIRCFKNNTIKISYENIVMANYNDISGKSSAMHDEVFSRELPVFYINKIHLLESKINYYNEYIKKFKLKSIIKILLGKKLF